MLLLLLFFNHFSKIFFFRFCFNLTCFFCQISLFLFVFYLIASIFHVLFLIYFYLIFSNHLFHLILFGYVTVLSFYCVTCRSLVSQNRLKIPQYASLHASLLQNRFSMSKFFETKTQLSRDLSYKFMKDLNQELFEIK